MLSAESVVRRRSDIPAHDVDDEVVMANIQGGYYYGLGKTARRIWQLLEAPSSVASLCDRLGVEYGEDPAALREDVLEFLQELDQEGLLELATAKESAP